MTAHASLWVKGHGSKPSFPKARPRRIPRSAGRTQQEHVSTCCFTLLLRCAVSTRLPSRTCVQSEHAPPFTRGHVLTGRAGGAGPPGGHPSTGQPFPGAGAPGQQLRHARAAQPSHSHLGRAEPPDPRPGVGPQPPACSCPGSGHPPFQGNLCPSSRTKEFPRPAAALSTQTLELWSLVRTLPMTPGRPAPLSSLLSDSDRPLRCWCQQVCSGPSCVVFLER